MDLQIPYIPKINDDILEAASRGRLVIFVGAGISKLIGLPDWKELSSIYIKTTYEKKLINHLSKEYLLKLNPKSALTICNKLLKKNGIEINLKDIFSIKELKSKSVNSLKNLELIDDLYSFNSIFVTTNYDDSLDLALEKCKNVQISSFPDRPELDYKQLSTITEKTKFDYSRCKIFYKDTGFLSAHLKNGNIFHLHGSISEKTSVILDIVSYIKMYNKNEFSEEILRKIFNEHTVLFIGYGLEELEILEYLIEKNIDLGKAVKHYLLKGFFEGEQDMIDLLNEYYSEINVQIIGYNLTQKGYDQIIDIIKSWSALINIQTKPKKHLDNIKLIDEYLNET